MASWLGEGPRQAREDHLIVDCAAHGTRGQSHEPSGSGVSSWTVAELRRLAPWRFIALPRRAAGKPDWPKHCPQNAATDHG
jgi:hypothetical protein